jgi:nucleoside-diphosphate kinase
MIQKTLSILKPDALQRNLTGAINDRFERAGLSLIAQKRMHLTYDQAASFYAVHKDRGFFQELCTYMSSGPVVIQVLQGEDAVAQNRLIMGATDPLKADPGTIRKDFGVSIDHNTVHGSDSEENAHQEIGFFFSQIEVLPT